MIKEEMLRLKNWAIVGATPKKDRFGYKIWKQMQEKGYTVYGVNPNYTSIDDIPVYATLSDIGKPVDAIDMIIGAKHVPAVLEEAQALGIRNIFFQPGSTDESVIERAEEMGFNIITDDCIYRSLNQKDYLSEV